MAKIGLVGGSVREWSLPFNAQRTVNLYPVVSQDGKEVSALYGTPGLSQFTTVGTGAIRGVFKSGTGRAFVVSGSKLYELFADGTSTERGSLEQSAGNVSISEIAPQLGICDGQNVYIFTYATNAFAKVSDPDLPSAGTITSVDGYFIVNENGTGKFYLSDLLNGLSWNPLSFATAESTPDSLLRVFNGIGQVWLFGETTTEIWNNTGDTVFPFERISGAQFNTGIAAPLSLVEIDRTLYWVGQDKGGVGTVYRTSGFNAQPISTPTLDQVLNRLSSLDGIVGYTYNQDGRKFYVITGGELETTWVFDLTTNIWHERAYLNELGEFEQHLGLCHMYAFGKHLLGDRVSNKIYEMSHEVYSDNGREILRQRTYAHVSDENQRIKISALEIDFEGGIGLQTGQGSDPVAALEVSKDGGKTWSIPMVNTIGKIGEYKKRVSFRRLGVGEEFTFRISVSDPVKVVMIGSYIK